ncbi:MAG: HEAT repeat domain-containing protein [Verrucomicrobiota bacterium]|jgi:HEAT repeat protein
MNRFALTIVTLAVLVAPWPAKADAAAGEENQLIAVLRSDRPPHDKDAACARLKRIGTARSVPALAALLADPALSHSARYALESMPAPEAGQALLSALGQSSGSNAVGIIHSLALRGQTAAAPAMAGLLNAADPDLAVAAAEALGRLGGATALEAALSRSTGRVHDAEIDGLLACANILLTEGKDAPARKTFKTIYDSETRDAARLAAFRGLILASGPDGLALMTNAIAGDGGPSQGAALQLASRAPGASATKALADLLPKVQAPVRIALLQCLGRRGDPSAAEAVARMTADADPHVRLAALAALGNVGDDTVALLLARLAAASSGAERGAARQSLLDLRHGPVTQALLEPFARTTPGVQFELIRALGGRGDQAAAPRLVEWAQGEYDSTRAAAFQALALLAGAPQLPGMVQLVVQAKSQEARSEAADALNSVCQRLQSQGAPAYEQPLVAAARNGPLEARLALLPVCGGLTNAPARDALRAALGDPEPRVRQAATRALCDTRDAELLPDLLKVARASDDQKLRVLAVRGCVRLATQEESVTLPGAQKLDALTIILDTPLEAPEKRLILSGLATIADVRALALAAPMLEDSAVEAEAARAVIAIAGAVCAAHPAEAGDALRKVLAANSDPATQKSARAVLQRIEISQQRRER